MPILVSMLFGLLDEMYMEHGDMEHGDKVHRILFSGRSVAFSILEMPTPYPRLHFIDLEGWIGVLVSYFFIYL